MKKLLLLFSALSISSIVNAQSISLTKNSDGSTVTNSSTLSVVSTVGGLPDENDYTVKNIGSTTKKILVKRTDLILNKINAATGDSALAYFCFGIACYPETVFISDTILFAPNDTKTLKTYMQEASALGYSLVKYQVYDANNTSDIISFTLSYNTALSVKENADLFTSVSNVYPNPSNVSATIKLQSSVNIKSAEVKITNTLGATVYLNTTELSIGENTVRLNTENLPSGIYFSTISYGKNKIIKKFVVNK
jgi:hypothetical protein